MSDEGPHTRRGWISSLVDPPKTVAGIVICLALIQIGMELATRGQLRAIWRAFELSPFFVHRAVEHGAWFKGLVTPLLGHILFHINLQHFIANAVAILLFGSLIQAELDAEAGDRRSDAAASFLAYFVLCGMFAGAFYIFALPKSMIPVVGASGAAAGLAGGAAWIAFMSGGATRMRVSLLALLSLFVIGGSIIVDTSKISTVIFGSISAWPLHVGGYLFGLFSYPFFERLARGR